MTADDHLCHVGYGDWCHPLYRPAKPDGETKDPTSVESIAWYAILQDMVLFAGLLGKKEDEARFRKLGELVRTAVRERFYDPATHSCDHGFWAASAMALVYGIVHEEERAAVTAALAESVRRERHRMVAGILGARFVLRALSENGCAEDACRMIVQPEYPGWGNLAAQGATALWERWDGKASRNHIMFGEPPAWMYRYLAGISPLEPGFRRVRFAPNFVSMVNQVRAEHLAPAGRIVSEWRRENGVVRCRFEIPSGVSALVELPGMSGEIHETSEFTVAF